MLDGFARVRSLSPTWEDPVSRAVGACPWARRIEFSGPVAAILTCRLATCTRPDRQWSGRNKGGVNGKACLGRVGGGRSGHSARRVRCHELSLRVQSRKNRLGWADLWGRVGGCRLLQGARAVLPVRGHPQPHVVAGLGSWGGVGRSTG